MPKPGLPINGETIEQIREIRFLSQAELAEAAKISRPYLNELERGAKPSAGPAILRRIAAELGVTVGALLARTRPRQGTEDADPTIEGIAS
ncbi:MAG: helix-turn-helix transcriptional regulator [Actinomycetota bacterium]